MLGWALIFLLVSLFAAILGLPGVAVISAEIAQFLFVAFLVIFLIALVFGLRGRRV